MHSKYWTLSLLTTLLMPTACGDSTSSAAADEASTETGDGNELGASGSESQDGGGASGEDAGLGRESEGDGDGDGGTIEGSGGSGIPGDGDPGDGDPGDGDGDAATSGAGDGDGDGDSGSSGDGDGDGDGGNSGDGDGDGDGGGDGDGDGGGDGGGDGDGDGGGDGDGDGDLLENPDNVCMTYHVLNLANRRISFNDGDGGIEWCDRTNSSDVDPQWQGLGWYRLMEPAGTMLPEYPPAVQSCGTEKPGWMIGEHPALVDGVVDRVVCFAWANDACQWQEDIKVVNCDGYYLYRLPDASTCSLRYCATAD
jgi:hypothetical protein